jgi:GMP synthase-like glutamine amidotransferase
MAHALGGKVDYLPGGREIGTLPISLSPAARGDALVGALPVEFRAHTTHELNRPGFPGHLMAMENGFDGGVHEQQAVYG